MQSTSTATKQVVWREGILLRPQHLQQQQRYFETQAQLRASLLHPFAWGLRSIEIDEQRLNQGHFSLRSVSAIFPNGLLVQVAPDTGDPLERSLLESFDQGQQEIVVYLGAPSVHTLSDAANADHGRTKAVGYHSSHFEIYDLTTPGQKASIELAWPQLTLLLGNEAQEHGNHFPIAKVIRQGQDHVLDPTYIAPTIGLIAGSGLEKTLRALLSKARQRRDELERARSQRDAQILSFDPQDLQRYLWLTSLGGSIALLDRMLHTPATTPFTLYLELHRWAGQLACLQQTVSARPSRGYNHARAQACFDPIFEQLFELLDLCVVRNYQVFDLKRRSDGMWLAKLDELNDEQNLGFVLAVKSEQGYERTSQRLPDLAKIASFSQISKVIDQAISGAEISYLSRPPTNIPLQADWVYFSIRPDNRYWHDIRQRRCVAFYAGPPFDGEDTQIRIYCAKKPTKD